MLRRWDQYVQTDAPAEWYRAWKCRHGGQAPRGLATVQKWVRDGRLALPSEPGSCAWIYRGYDGGRPVTHVSSGLAALDAYLATITTSKVAQAAIARGYRWPHPAVVTDCRAGSTPTPTPPHR